MRKAHLLLALALLLPSPQMMAMRMVKRAKVPKIGRRHKKSGGFKKLNLVVRPLEG